MTKLPSTRRASSEAALGLCGLDASNPIDHELPRAKLAVVGIGCPAGGLDALDRFFADAPTSSGMAFVVVRHLDPTHISNLPELLQRLETELRQCGLAQAGGAAPP